MKKIRHLALAGCSLVLLTQCATQDEVRELNYQLRAVNQKLEDVKSNTVNKMQQRQASSVNKIDEVESETLRLKSLLEESAHQSSLIREQAKEDIASLQSTMETLVQENQAKFDLLDQKIAALEAQLSGVSNSYERLQKARIAEAEKRAREAARKAAETAAAAQRSAISSQRSTSSNLSVRPEATKIKVGDATVIDAQPKPQPRTNVSQPRVETQQEPTSVPATVQNTVPAPVEEQGAEPLDQAIGEYKAKQYQKAYQSLEEILATNPQGHKAAQTLFYMGECLFAQGEYDLAILDYQKVISNHTQDSLAPQALLKQGMSFEKLTDIETAKIIYRKLLNDYSSSAEAKQAKQKIDSL